jgi:hypothetical protein
MRAQAHGWLGFAQASQSKHPSTGKKRIEAWKYAAADKRLTCGVTVTVQYSVTWFVSGARLPRVSISLTVWQVLYSVVDLQSLHLLPSSRWCSRELPPLLSHPQTFGAHRSGRIRG